MFDFWKSEKKVATAYIFHPILVFCYLAESVEKEGGKSLWHTFCPPLQ